jgi:colicin import membrane protein
VRGFPESVIVKNHIRLLAALCASASFGIRVVASIPGDNCMAKITKAAVRPKKSRAEVEQEFETVRQEVAASRESVDRKAEELSKANELEVRQAVEGITMEDVVRRISDLGIEISKALAGLSDKLVGEVNVLASAREAVALEQRELERLHKIDVAATALDQLVQDYGLQRKDLEEQIAAQRAAWEDERRQSERERKEQEENLRKQRQRDIEDYEYKKSLERKKAQDQYDEEMKALERQNREKQEAMEKSWQQREAALKEREEEFARLKKESEEFPATLKRESERAASQATRAAQEKYERELASLKKESESDKRLGELQVKTLQEEIARQAAHVLALQKQADEAKQQVQEIAVRAIEGASGARALAHINEIAIEQAKHRSPQS